MPSIVEDLDRRVTALELAQSARGENATARLEQKVEAFPRAVAELIAEKIAESEDRLKEVISTSVQASELRMRDTVSASERRMVDILNERFDAVMTALDRRQRP
jgi:hypothetical protein